MVRLGAEGKVQGSGDTDDDVDSDDGEDGDKMIFPQPPGQRKHIENNLSMLSLTGNTLRH